MLYVNMYDEPSNMFLHSVKQKKKKPRSFSNLGNCKFRCFDILAVCCLSLLSHDRKLVRYMYFLVFIAVSVEHRSVPDNYEVFKIYLENECYPRIMLEKT